MKGLARLSKDGFDSVRSTVNELERYGYVTRRRIRTETGQLADTEYLVPAIVRPLENGEYEMISGHRRRYASMLAGKETMPVIVREMDDDTATILMVDSNLQREHILPSERAKAYQMKQGTVEPFTAKDGREMLKIMIPNADRSDHTPWASFILPAKAVHENQYGKGLWAKIPADGHTTLTRPYLAGQSEDGKNIWKDEKTTVSNRELKSMVEFYKKDLVPKYDIPEL